MRGTAAVTSAGPGRAAVGSGRSTPGAVVLGGDYQGLGIARSLGRRGISVSVLDDERSVAGVSRYVQHVLRVPSLRHELEVVTALHDLASAQDVAGWVVFPTREEMVAAVSRQRKLLSQTFRLTTGSWETTRLAWDKRQTYAVAADAGVPVPRTWNPVQISDLELVDAAVPVVLKPAIKEHFIYVTKVKGWRAEGPEELRQIFERAQQFMPSGEVLVQELIPGGSSQQFAYCAHFQSGRATASMTVQRRRQHPPELGRASTLVETVDLPDVAALGERVLAAMAVEGLAEVEFVRDPRTGGYLLLDVNARTWGYHSLGPVAGVDFVHDVFLAQLGEPPTHPPGLEARSGVRWVRLLTDTPTAAAQVRRGELDWRDWWRSVRSSDTEAVLALDDPLPFAYELALTPYLLTKRGW